MSYTALYRKYRPNDFDGVLGQEPIVATLKNQIKYDRIAHAYLFCGTRGTGKTTVAKIFAKAVNCSSPIEGNPCNNCETCQSMGAAGNTNIIEIDAASNNSVDNVRRIREEVKYRPTFGKYKVYIIDEAHMLSIGAFNALLKTLEEPPEYVIFILATTEISKIPVTILSRCQRYDFKRISLDTITSNLSQLLSKENIKAEEKGLRYIARLADGSMRDALSLLDRCISCYMGETLTYEDILEVVGSADTEDFKNLLEALSRSDTGKAISLLNAYVDKGRDLSNFATDFTQYMRNLLLIKSDDSLEELLDMSGENIASLKSVGENIKESTLMRFINISAGLSLTLKTTPAKRIYTELALIKMCCPETEADREAVLQRLDSLEERMDKGIPSYNVPHKDEPAALPKAVSEKAEEEAIKKPAPEDLKKISAEWKNIVESIDNPMIKPYLLSSGINYNSQTGECKLYITPSNDTAYSFLSLGDDKREMIVEAIKSETGLTVPVGFVEPSKKDKAYKEIPIEEKINREINFPVETI